MKTTSRTVATLSLASLVFITRGKREEQGTASGQSVNDLANGAAAQVSAREV